jgi:membrane-associated phospholipid phosphatase
MLRLLDQKIFLYLNQNFHNRLGDWFFPFITSPYHLAWIVAIFGLWMLWKGNSLHDISHRQKVIFILLIFTLCISDALNTMVKELVGRLRPFLTLENVRLLVGQGDSYSFPSGHAANSSAIATVIAYEYRKKKWVYIPVIILALLICYSRIYVGVHYPLDVLGGILLGIFCGTGILFLDKYYPILISEKGKRDRISYFGIFLLIFILSTVYRLSYIAAAHHTLSPEEAQYWDWSRHLDWSYYSKPPLIAYLIRFFTMLFGTTAFSVRLGSVICSIFLGIITWKWTKEMFGSDRVAFFTTFILNFIPLYAVGAILMTTDTPLGIFWAATLYALYRAIFINQKSAWYLSGFLFGLGMLSKYTMVLLVPCLFIYFLISSEHRFWLKRKEPYQAMLIGFIMFLPVIYWNYAYGWVTFKHVAEQANVPGGFILQPKEFFNFLGSQFGVISPFLFLGMMYSSYVMIRKWASGKPHRSIPDVEIKMDNKLKFLLCTSIPVYLFFQIKSIQGKVEANWAANAYYSWTIFMVIYFDQWYQKKEISKKTGLLRVCIWLSILCAILITVVMHDTNLIREMGIHFPLSKDPTTRLVGWNQLGSQVTNVELAMPQPSKTFLFSEQYQLTAELAFYVKGQPSVYCVNLDRRMNQYDLWPGIGNWQGWNAVYVTYDEPKSLDSRIKNSFDKIEPPLICHVMKNELVYNRFRIYRCYGFHGKMAGEIKPSRF